MTPPDLPVAIPSPGDSVWHLGPFPVRAYALCIVVGVVVAVWIGERRWRARGGAPGVVGDIASWGVPMGIVGGRLYHVVTTPEPYFGSGGEPIEALYVWKGGLGIWGAVAFGVLGAWIACRRRGVPLLPALDSIAPGIAVAQAIGRLGNWFNQELYGKPTDLPWGLEIDADQRPADSPTQETYHPTFLYESLWNLAVAALVVWADRRWRLGAGRAFALYVAAYTAGRFWIEALRVDSAHDIFGVRLNVWVSAVVFAAAVGYLLVRRGAAREDPVELNARRRDLPAASPGGHASRPT